MQEMSLRAVGETADGESMVVVLDEVHGDRVLVLGIGAAEATSIAWAVENVTLLRPMTHDLMVDLIGRLGESLQRILIHDIQEETVIGQLEIETSSGVVEVDARPSDCIALAVRTEAPIYASEQVLEAIAVPGDAFEMEDGPDSS